MIVYYQTYGAENGGWRLDRTVNNSMEHDYSPSVALSRTIFSSIDLYNYYNQSEVVFTGTSTSEPELPYLDENTINAFIDNTFDTLYIIPTTDYPTFKFGVQQDYYIQMGETNDNYGTTLWFNLDTNSPFWQTININTHYFAIPRKFLEDNGLDFKFGNTYTFHFNELDDTFIYSLNYEINGDSTQQAIINTNDKLNDINNFLNDENYNQEDITNNMPSNELQDPTENAFNNIFTSFRNAFVNDNPPDFEFEIPFTKGQKITITADYISSKLYPPIVSLIQAFYWFIICRYIVKDIAITVENAKSGKILDSKDGNIKTELL